jgi:hypothetical protein
LILIGKYFKGVYIYIICLPKDAWIKREQKNITIGNLDEKDMV